MDKKELKKGEKYGFIKKDKNGYRRTREGVVIEFTSRPLNKKSAAKETITKVIYKPEQ